ncbi:MAG: HD domain-containing protein [Bacteriovoracaceae bacterium]|nr:HD domain-containing protein [Bacteriovoracaceae bacterium]
MSDQNKSFFSVGFEFVLINKPLPYDLFVNSSAVKGKERFVRIYPNGGSLTKEEVLNFKHKYHQLYILEEQRDSYLRSLVQCEKADDVAKSEVIKDSAIVYLTKIFDEEKEFTTEYLGEAIEGCRDSVESMIDVIKDYDVKKVQELIGNLSFHDFYTYDHSINVSMYCIVLFQAWNPKASREDIVMAGLGGLLHDLGKIKIPTTIINNPGKLNDEEFAEIKKHPDYGKTLLAEGNYDMPGVDFNIISRIIHEHHENFNGTGYPSNMHGENIHVLARITAIADFFDAITTKRSYHDVLSVEDALEVMGKTVGKKLDPELFDLFVKNVSNIVLKGKVKDVLPDDFDPCQPHETLPFEKVPVNYKDKNIFEGNKSKEFGKIKSDFSISSDETKDKKKKAS